MIKKIQIRYDNLSREDRDALRDLQTDMSIVIKPADKGGAIVIQNNVDYVQECERQLSDSDFYEKLSGDPTQMFKNKIHTTLYLMFQNGEITKRELDF